MFSFQRIKLLLFLIICLLFIQELSATTWVTKAGGNWNAAGTWQGGMVPPIVSADTFMIKHAVYINNDLTFNAHALLKIDSSGGLCGHYKITVSAGATLMKYGTLDLDILAIPGGLVNFYNPGSVTLTMYGVISAGGALYSNGCAVNVGPWFTCVFGDTPNGIETLNMPVCNLFPNPCNGIFTIETQNAGNDVSYMLYDINSQLVLSGASLHNLSEEGNTIRIDAGNLPEGVYTLCMKTSTGILNKRLLIIK